MEQTTLIKKLSALGLPEKDATTYLALLKLGPSPVQAITKETGLNRSSLYVVLERLLKGGFVTTTGDQGVRQYVALPPERIVGVAKERYEQAVLTRQNLETLLPELEKHRKLTLHRPTMKTLTGRAGIRSGFEYTLDVHEKKIRIVSDAGSIIKSVPDYLPRYIRERFRRGIQMIGIHPYDTAGKMMIALSSENIDDQVFVPPEKYSFPSDFGIFDNKVAFMDHKKRLCVFIESKAIADNMKALFDLAYEDAKRVGKHFPPNK